MADPILQAKNLSFSYSSDKPTLTDVSLSLEAGQVLAILGPNGSGKTTFIKILATLLTKDSGDIEIMGYNLDRDVDPIRHLFGYVGQDLYGSGQKLGTEAISRFGLKQGDRAMVWGLLSQPTRGLRTKGAIDSLQAAGVTVTHRHHHDMFHDFFAFVNLIDAGNEAVKQVGGEIRARLATLNAAAV